MLNDADGLVFVSAQRGLGAASPCSPDAPRRGRAPTTPAVSAFALAMPSAIGRVSAPKRTFLAPGVGARSRTRPVATRHECVAQHWPPVPPRGHCECRMEVFVSLRGFSTAQ